MVAIQIATVGFPPCLPSLQTPVHKGGSQRPPGAPPFVNTLMDECLEAGWARRKSDLGDLNFHPTEVI